GPQLRPWTKVATRMSTGSQKPLMTRTVSIANRTNITSAVGPNHLLAAAAGSPRRISFAACSGCALIEARTSSRHSDQFVRRAQADAHLPISLTHRAQATE